MLLRCGWRGATDAVLVVCCMCICLRQEARNCERFGQLYGNIEGIYVPSVYHNLTSRRVLTMEWVDGEKVRPRPGRQGGRDGQTRGREGRGSSMAESLG